MFIDIFQDLKIYFYKMFYCITSIFEWIRQGWLVCIMYMVRFVPCDVVCMGRVEPCTVVELCRLFYDSFAVLPTHCTKARVSSVSGVSTESSEFRISIVSRVSRASRVSIVSRVLRVSMISKVSSQSKSKTKL